MYIHVYIYFFIYLYIYEFVYILLELYIVNYFPYIRVKPSFAIISGIVSNYFFVELL